jgi:hypothetical protein
MRCALITTGNEDNIGTLHYLRESAPGRFDSSVDEMNRGSSTVLRQADGPDWA